LSTYLAAQLLVETSLVTGAVAAPIPYGFFFGERSIEQLEGFPSLSISAINSPIKDSQYHYDEISHTIQIIAWIVEVDPETLHRFVLRYANAIREVLRDESKWGNELHSPSIVQTQYSEVYNADHGLAQACRVQVEIKEVR
jgi:hypothetical protein